MSLSKTFPRIDLGYPTGSPSQRLIQAYILIAEETLQI